MYILSIQYEGDKKVNVCAFIRFPSQGLLTMKTFMGERLTEEEATELLETGIVTKEYVGTFLLNSIMVIDEDLL